MYQPGAMEKEQALDLDRIFIVGILQFGAEDWTQLSCPPSVHFTHE